MRVIFLDIDGVLNSDQRAKEIHDRFDQGLATQEEANNWDLPYEGTLVPLKHIIDQTGAQIVLSSCWRYNPERIEALNKVFSPYGFQIMDQTPIARITLKTLFNIGVSKKQIHDYHSMYAGENCDPYTTDRGAEIAIYLHRHPEIESFVILDDDIFDIKTYFPGKTVRPNFYKGGLNMDLANQAINILLNKKSEEAVL